METLVTTLAAIGLVNMTFGLTLAGKVRVRNIVMHLVIGLISVILALHFGHWDLLWVLEAHKQPGMNPWMTSIAFLAAFIPLILMDVSKGSTQKSRN